jgi:hypothetical protein
MMSGGRSERRRGAVKRFAENLAIRTCVGSRADLEEKEAASEHGWAGRLPAPTKGATTIRIGLC